MDNGNIKYPDRSQDIEFLQMLIERAVANKDYETANLNFAKIIEAMRQQNINMDNALTPVLEDSKRIYAEFRAMHNLQYPAAFAQNIEGEWKFDAVTEYYELLKKATAQSTNNINEAIETIRKAIDLNPEEFQGYKKLAGYLQKAGRFDEAVKILNNQLTKGNTEIFDYLAVLYKKEKRDIEAMTYESYSIYVYTMLVGPNAYRTPTDFINSIRLKRKYKPQELAAKLDSEMKMFWGDAWLTDYHRKFLAIWNEVHNGSYTYEKFQQRLTTIMEDKTFEKYAEFIKRII